MMKDFDYSLLDFGEGRKLERFGNIIVDRPSPQATNKKRLNRNIWDASDCYFDKSTGWIIKNDKALVSWIIDVMGFKVTLKLSSSGQIGIFPEQYPNWVFLNKIASSIDTPINVLNGFFYTGVSAIVLSSAVFNITNVDGSKTAVNWAKSNITANNINSNMRFIAEDMLTFVKREIRRGNRYNGFIFDPPEFGRGPGGEWVLKKDIFSLIDNINLLADNPRFFILTTHAQWINKKVLKDIVERLNFIENNLEIFELNIISEQGDTLPMGHCARWAKL